MHRTATEQSWGAQSRRRARNEGVVGSGGVGEFRAGGALELGGARRVGTLVADLGRLWVPWLGVDLTTASARVTARLHRVSGTNGMTAHRFWGMQTVIALIDEGRMALMPALTLRGIAHDAVVLPMFQAWAHVGSCCAGTRAVRKRPRTH